MGMDPGVSALSEILMQFAPLMAAVWLATEGIHRAFGKRLNPWIIALALGQVGALAAWQVGFVTVPGEAPWSWVWCSVLGVFASMSAGKLATWLNQMGDSPMGTAGTGDGGGKS